MAILKVQEGTGNKILRTRSAEVKLKNKKLKKLFIDMRETMLSLNGVGLAAPQVGENIRVCVCFFNQGSNNELIVDMINPVITRSSRETEVAEEGCLSLPGQFGSVARHTGVTVRYFDLKGEERVLQLKGLNAVIIQHEIDHLDGILFVDKLAEQVSKDQRIL